MTPLCTGFYTTYNIHQKAFVTYALLQRTEA